MIKLKRLNQKVDYYGDTWIVNTISKADILENDALQDYLKGIKLTDSDMERIAEKMADYMQEDYWMCLEEAVKYVKEEK